MELSKVHHLYLNLRRKHGPARDIWPQWCAAKKSLRTRELVALGAILTQRTSWHNADLALRNLKKAGLLSLEKIALLRDLGELATLVKPAGFHQSKPKRLFTFASFVTAGYKNLERFKGVPLKEARENLLSLYGIGPETADTILLYALDKPSFVVDEYTKRLVKKKRLATRLDYDYLKSLFEANLPRSVRLYQDFHALIIVEEKGRPGSVMRKV